MCRLCTYLKYGVFIARLSCDRNEIFQNAFFHFSSTPKIRIFGAEIVYIIQFTRKTSDFDKFVVWIVFKTKTFLMIWKAMKKVFIRNVKTTRTHFDIIYDTHTSKCQNQWETLNESYGRKNNLIFLNVAIGAIIQSENRETGKEEIDRCGEKSIRQCVCLSFSGHSMIGMQRCIDSISYRNGICITKAELDRMREDAFVWFCSFFECLFVTIFHRFSHVFFSLFILIIHFSIILLLFAF